MNAPAHVNDDPATDHTGLRVMGLDECLRRVASIPVGRFAFLLDAEISVLPVVHIVDGVDVCFRTSGNAKTETAVGHDRVAYQVDSWDASARTGWSVLIQGVAELVHDDHEIARFESAADEPWVLPPGPGGRHRWIRVRAASVSGRALE